MDQATEIITDLFERMHDMLLGYAKSSLGNYALAEEAVQETFVIAWVKQEDLCSSPSPEGWLMNTMKNVIFNMQRVQTNENRFLREYIAVHGPDAAITKDRIDFDILYEDIAGTEELKLIKERILGGYTHPEMARRHGISILACRKRLQRAREMLQKYFSK